MAMMFPPVPESFLGLFGPGATLVWQDEQLGLFTIQSLPRASTVPLHDNSGTTGCALPPLSAVTVVEVRAGLEYFLSSQSL